MNPEHHRAETIELENDPAAQSDWHSFAILAVTLSIGQFGFYLTSAAFSLYLHDLGVSQSRIGFEVGLASIASLAVTLALGPALNRYGSKVFLAAGSLFYVAATLGMLALRGEVSAAAFRTLQGVGAAAILPSAFTMGARLVANRPATALGLLGAVNNISLAIGPALGLVLYTGHGATWLFLPATASAGIGFLLTSRLPRLPSVRSEAGFGFDRAWLPAIAVMGLGAVYFGGILAYLPLYLQRLHGPNAGIFFTADAVGVLLLRIPTGMLVDRRGSLLPKVLGVALAIPGIAVLALTPSILVLSLSGALTGIGAGLLITGVMADLSILSTDANRGTAMSMGTASFSGAIFIGGAVSGLLVGPGGFNAVLLFGLITCFVALPFALGWGAPPPQPSM